VADIQNVPVRDVTVYLLRSADSSVVRFTICDKEGRFEFNDLTPNSYLIKVTDISYIKATTKVYRLGRSTSIDIGTIKLQLSNKILEQVDIQSEKSFIENKPGKKILNIQNSVTAIGSNALEILKKAPGVKVDNDNNISLEGKNNVLVLIDNKPTYMPPEALIDMLQATPSSMISQIELINSLAQDMMQQMAGLLISNFYVAKIWGSTDRQTLREGHSRLVTTMVRGLEALLGLTLTGVQKI